MPDSQVAILLEYFRLNSSVKPQMIMRLGLQTENDHIIHPLYFPALTGGEIIGEQICCPNKTKIPTNSKKY